MKHTDPSWDFQKCSNWLQPSNEDTGYTEVWTVWCRSKTCACPVSILEANSLTPVVLQQLGRGAYHLQQKFGWAEGAGVQAGQSPSTPACWLPGVGRGGDGGGVDPALAAAGSGCWANRASVMSSFPHVFPQLIVMSCLGLLSSSHLIHFVSVVSQTKMLEHLTVYAFKEVEKAAFC